MRWHGDQVRRHVSETLGQVICEDLPHRDGQRFTIGLLHLQHGIAHDSGINAYCKRRVKAQSLTSAIRTVPRIRRDTFGNRTSTFSTRTLTGCRKVALTSRAQMNRGEFIGSVSQRYRAQCTNRWIQQVGGSRDCGPQPEKSGRRTLRLVRLSLLRSCRHSASNTVLAQIFRSNVVETSPFLTWFQTLAACTISARAECRRLPSYRPPNVVPSYQNFNAHIVSTSLQLSVEIDQLPEPATSVPYLPSRRTSLASGQPISELMSRALDNPELISLAAGFVDGTTLPVDIVRQITSELLASDARARTMLQYGSTFGLVELREAILKQYADSAQPVDLDQIVVSAGSNQLLHLVAESLLDPGDIVLCASPTYFVFLGTVANLGGRTWGVATDELGMIPEDLEATLEQLDASGDLPRVKAIYLVPYFDNPSGITMPADRVQRIVEIAQRWSQANRIHVISDEAYRELTYDDETLTSAREFDEDGETVIVAGTFSKSFSPGIRVGWGILPKHLAGPVGDLKSNIDFGSPNLNQHVMAEVLQRDLFDEHVLALRRSYKKKLDAMLDAAEEFLRPIEGVGWHRPTGGLYVWATLPDHIDTGPTGELFDRAMAEGMLYVPGHYCFASEGQPVKRNTMRLSFGVQSCEGIRRGMEALARAIQAVV